MRVSGTRACRRSGPGRFVRTVAGAEVTRAEGLIRNGTRLLPGHEVTPLLGHWTMMAAEDEVAEATFPRRS